MKKIDNYYVKGAIANPMWRYKDNKLYALQHCTSTIYFYFKYDIYNNHIVDIVCNDC